LLVVQRRGDREGVEVAQVVGGDDELSLGKVLQALHLQAKHGPHRQTIEREAAGRNGGTQSTKGFQQAHLPLIEHLLRFFQR
jgi:hypothetical protein